MTKRVLLGKLPDGPNGYGLRVSKSGYDVTALRPGTAGSSDNEKLIFNSDWGGVLPILMNGITSVGAGGTASVSYTSNLGYYPFASALININGRGWESLQYMNLCYRLTNQPHRSYYTYNAQQYSVSSKSSDATVVISANPQNTYTYAGDRTDIVQYRLYTDHLEFYCSQAAQLYYIVYAVKAF